MVNGVQIAVGSPIVQVSAGHYLSVTDPNPADIFITDIAAALSKICRFNGHCNHFYSVAQHSVRVAEMVPDDFKLEALLHDAAEAYIGDMCTPIKALFPEFKKMENTIQSAIHYRFDMPDRPMSPEVKVADLRMLAIEKRSLMPKPEDEWDILKGIELADDELIIRCLKPPIAALDFMDAFYKYYELHKA